MPEAMDIRVSYIEDPARVLSLAEEFLASRPALHNVTLTILHERVARSEPGRYWLARRGEKIVGVVLQSPLDWLANLVPMEPDVTAAMVDAIASAGIALPGVNGEAATAASFAGQWTERCKSAAVPFQGQRIYEYFGGAERVDGAGTLRKAGPENRDLIAAWVKGFLDDVGEHATAPERFVDRWLPTGQIRLWDDGGPKSMAVPRGPAGGVIRVSLVYTPPEHRRHGYAAACVQNLSEAMRAAGNRCILHTDLNNATSNSVYRRIGYRAIAECLRYRFG